MRKMAAARRLLIAAALTTMPGGCGAVDSISPERAVAERAAIHHDLRNDTGTLYAIAAKRAKSTRSDLRNRSVVCAISNVEIQFVREDRAAYRVSYACGAAPWQLGQTPPLATPTVALDLLKEHGTWLINGFL